MAWKKYGTEPAIKEIWEAVAHVTRYGRATLNEALRLPPHHMARYLEAISGIIDAENGPAGLREK